MGWHNDKFCLDAAVRGLWWVPVVSGTDVGDIRLPAHQMFGAAEVTKFENSTVGIQQQILRFDVAVTDAVGVNVGKWSEQHLVSYLSPW